MSFRAFPLGIRSLAPALVLMACAAVSVSPVAAQKRPMTIVDLIGVPSVGSPQPSPDGERIVYVKSEADWAENRTISHLFLVNADGTGTRQLTYGKEGQSSPLWSPDGEHIAFLARRGDQDVTQIHLLPADGGEARPLTDHETSVGSMAWSPEGAFLYFLATDPKSDEEKEKEERGDDVFAFDEDYRQRHLWKVNVETGEESRVTEGDFSIGGYTLGRDGARVAHVRTPTPLLNDIDKAEIFLMDVDGSSPVQLTTDTVPQSGPEFSPDGRHVLFTADSNQEWDFYYNDKIFIVPAAGGEVRTLLPDFPGSVSGATWSADGRSVLFVASVGVRRELFRAASSGAGASNWISMYAQSDVRVYRTPWFGGNPWEAEAPTDQYWDDSPLKYAAEVTTPTLFLVGENDARVPMPQSVEMYRALKANGVPTHLYVAPRQGHGWRELHHRLFKANVEMDWWERWIMDREWTWEEAPEADGG